MRERCSLRRNGSGVDVYQSRVLRIDLSALAAEVEPLRIDWAEKYFGGRGLSLRYLWEVLPSKTDPWPPENPMILISGSYKRRHHRTPGHEASDLGRGGLFHSARDKAAGVLLAQGHRLIQREP